MDPLFRRCALPDVCGGLEWLRSMSRRGQDCGMSTLALTKRLFTNILLHLQNQMQEALLLFESIMSLTWFKSSSIILFLNKTDLFKEKISEKPVSDYFPDYTGANNDFQAAASYFASKFRALNRTEDREIYVHYTNATDTNLLKLTMASVQDTIIQSNLETLIL